MRTYDSEFPDFGPIDVVLPKGFVDTSWHNDTCPSFTYYLTEDAYEAQIRVCVDYKDPASREMASEYRFSVDVKDENDDYVADLMTNDWDEVLDFIAEWSCT